MAKGSPAKGSPAKGGSPKKSGSPAKGSKSDDKKKKSPEKRNLPKWSAEECIKADLETFARRRYEVPMDTSYKRVTFHISLIVKKIHLFEVFNEAPEVKQLCNSNKGSKGSPKSKSGSPKGKGSPKEKGSPKSKKSPEEEEPPPPVYEKPILEGVVAMRRQFLLLKDEKLFVEVTATWRYREYSKVTPFAPQIRVEKVCYRDYYFIKPANFERSVLPTPYNQTLINKIRDEYGSEWEGYPFYFDLSGAPSSLTFNRPYYHNNPEDGLFWVMRAFIGKYEFSRPTPDKEVRINFWKFTIAPSLLTHALRQSKPCNYIRYKTQDDIGDLILTGSLNRDLFYHGEEINVTINIENNSQRHVIQSITVFFEQTYRFFNEIPHDHSIPLNEVWLKPGENGLPIHPKSKNWNKLVQIKPIFDWSKYNLVCDGKMERDEKVFLASSTIIMKDIPLTLEEIAELEEAENKSPKKKGSPDKGKKSPKKESPKKESPTKESPKKGSPKKGSPKKEKSPPKEEPPPEVPADVEPPPVPTKRVLVNRELSHSVFINYDVVVRLNLQTPTDKEAGHPAVRIPFILTRETRYINKWTNPPTYDHRPLKCDRVHTDKSQPHAFCQKLERKTEPMSKSPNSKKESKKSSPKKDSPKKSSPKVKSK